MDGPARMHEKGRGVSAGWMRAMWVGGAYTRQVRTFHRCADERAGLGDGASVRTLSKR